MIERSDVLLPKAAPWLEEFRRELLQFPTAKNDDQVDAFSQFLAHMDHRHRNKAFAGELDEFLFGRRKSTPR